jgi:hypothetical protein
MDQSRISQKAFWKSGFRVCPSCEESNIKTETRSVGCRQNGDGYGIDTFICEHCTWSTSFQYDDASTPFYYYSIIPFEKTLQQPKRVKFFMKLLQRKLENLNQK